MMTNPGTFNDATFNQATQNPPLEPGYRFLALGETVQKDDQIDMGGLCGWAPVVSRLVGAPVGKRDIFRRKVEATVDPGEGYRTLSPGETICLGDEIFTGGRWETTMCPGTKVIDGTFRRKVETPKPATVDPGAGYRILAPTEILHEGDEFRCGPKWTKTRYAGKCAKDGCPPYRRNIEQERREFGEKIRATLRPAEKLFAVETPAGRLDIFSGSSPAAPVYRMLSEGEPIKDGDEFLDAYSWRPVSRAPVGTDLLKCNVGRYRRKVELGFVSPGELPSELQQLRDALASSKGYAAELERDCKASDKEIASLTIDVRNYEARINELTKERDAFGEALEAIAKLTEVTK